MAILSTLCLTVKKQTPAYTCKAEKEMQMLRYILDKHVLIKLKDAKGRCLFSR